MSQEAKNLLEATFGNLLDRAVEKGEFFLAYMYANELEKLENM